MAGTESIEGEVRMPVEDHRESQGSGPKYGADFIGCHG
jgi:hypothetical protein